MDVIDRKFKINAVNPVNGKTYTEADSLLLCAKDAAVPQTLAAYAVECMRLGANPEHIRSIRLLHQRVVDFQKEMGGGRVPDTVGAEIPRCIHGEGISECLPADFGVIPPSSMMFTGEDFIAAIREIYEEWQDMKNQLEGDKTRLPDFEAAVDHFARYGMAGSTLNINLVDTAPPLK
jgi:hypothetical protein